MESTEFVKYILLAIGLVMVMAVVVIVSLELFRKKVIQEKMRNAELKLKHQTELLHTVIRSQEEERRRVSDALHDDIGSKLTTIKLSLHQLKAGEGDGPLPDVLALTEKVVDSTRELSHAYSPVVLEKFGLEAGIEELLDSLPKTENGPKGQLDAFIQDGLLDQEGRLILYRITQELLNNTVKHAEASKVFVNIRIDSKGIDYRYQDNGKGFDDQEVADGIGMLNIQNRVAMMEGVLAIDSKAGKGFILTIKKSF
ncbi:sensor histidine kinase [Echinicola vietnamensis]|uniref:histidine kinase n=1 Tax=Echinicola vietnamensis (strain DSM 17526 / LMG 23754 / KMM 6221) TaxID=926556 RepID=L0G599_ECHVK|nr:ATP-binding protein [Echinicola vietnamensis]AGA80722.1 histidine kinase [Echinicola vietnamensis DSM 17526]